MSILNIYIICWTSNLLVFLCVFLCMFFSPTGLVQLYYRWYPTQILLDYWATFCRVWIPDIANVTPCNMGCEFSFWEEVPGRGAYEAC